MTPGSRNLLLLGGGLVVVVVVLLVTMRRGPESREEGPPGASATTTERGAVSPSLGSGTATPGGEAGVAPAAGTTSAEGVELGTALLGAKKLAAARAALAEGNPKKAIEELESYEKVPDAPLKQEATVLKIEALAKGGRRSDALALAMSTRDDPAYDPHRAKIEALIADAGLIRQ